MTTLRYKDYQGSVEFEDGSLVIQVLHINDIVTTSVDRADAAQAAFEELVDDYLATCKELGKEPNKPFKGSFNIRVSPELHRQIAMAAADLGQTMNSWVEKALETRMERQRTHKTVLDPKYIVRQLETTSHSKYALESKFPHARWFEETSERFGITIVNELERQKAN